MDQQINHDIQRLIKAHIDIFGIDVAVGAIKDVNGLVIKPNGTIQTIAGDPNTILKGVVDRYHSVSGNLSFQIINAHRTF